MVALAGATVLIDLKEMRLAIDIQIAFLTQFLRKRNGYGFAMFDTPPRKIQPGT